LKENNVPEMNGAAEANVARRKQ